MVSLHYSVCRSRETLSHAQKNEKTWTILGAPHKLYHSTLTNAVANAHRGVWVKSGREADTEHRARANSKRQKLSHAVGHENDGAKDAMNTRGKEGNPDIGTAPGKYESHVLGF